MSRTWSHEARGTEQHGAPGPRRTSHWSRRPTALYLYWVTWENPRYQLDGRDRPSSLRSTETGAELGPSRPLLPEPVQLPGAIEPAFCKVGPARSRYVTAPTLCRY